MIRLAVIGLGHRATGLLKLGRRINSSLQLVAAADNQLDTARQHLSGLQLAHEPALFDDVDALLQHGPAFDAILVGTNCHAHTPIALKLADAGVDVPIMLEKPVAISTEQAERLAQAYRGREDRFVISFPLRVTPLLQKVLQIVRSGRLGTINQVQAHNDVPYGGVYFGQWYRDFDATGGLWLQKATHDFDYLNAIIDAEPQAVAATHSRRIFGGDMPDHLRCAECDRTDTCLESPQNQAARGDTGGMDKDDHWCAFSQSIKHQDAGSALLLYSNGVHAAYSQNFAVRRSAGRRGARVVGYHATLDFDWGNEFVRVTEHHGNTVEDVPVDTTNEGHGGGDQILLQNFFELIRGEAPSHTPLSDGLLSAAMCLAARTSATTCTFQPIVRPGTTQTPAPDTSASLIEPSP